MSNPAPILPVRLLPLTGSSHDRVAVVTDEGREVVVRWRLGRAVLWRCGLCGPMETADCLHTFAAGVALAEQLLGLTRVPSLHPNEGEQHP